MNSLNEMQEGIIKEIGNIGAGHVMMSLSQMSKVKTSMDITRVYEFTKESFRDVSSSLSDKVCAVHFAIDPAPSGGFLLLLPKDAPDSLLITLRSSSNSTFINFTKSYTKSLEEYLGIRCGLRYLKWHERPECDLLSEIFSRSFDNGDRILVIDTRYSTADTGMSGHTFLYFNSESYDDLVKMIDRKLQEMVA